MSDPLENMPVVEEAHGWRFGCSEAYPDIVVIACPCGHLSVRDREEVAEHVCPSCQRHGIQRRSGT